MIPWREIASERHQAHREDWGSALTAPLMDGKPDRSAEPRRAPEGPPSTIIDLTDVDDVPDPPGGPA